MISETTTLRDEILAEIKADAPVIAQRLFGQGEHADATGVRKADYLKYLRTMWDDAGFRGRLRKQIGDHKFIQTAAEVLGQPRPTIHTDNNGRSQVLWNDSLAGMPASDAEDMLNASGGGEDVSGLSA